MTEWHENQERDPELMDVAARLRAERPQASALELDRIKLNAKSRALTTRRKGIAVRSRLIAPLVAIGLMGGGTAGVLAGGHTNGGNDNNSGNSQYCPPSSPNGGDSKHATSDANDNKGASCGHATQNGSNQGGS